jgi:uncharacterized membrane protein
MSLYVALCPIISHHSLHICDIFQTLICGIGIFLVGVVIAAVYPLGHIPLLFGIGGTLILLFFIGTFAYEPKNVWH